MAKSLNPGSNPSSSTCSSSTEEEPWLSGTKHFFETSGISQKLPEGSEKIEFLNDLTRSLLKVERVERGRVTCNFAVKAPVVNVFRTLHGGMIAAIAEVVAVACAKSVAGVKELFLGELAISYLSGSKLNAEVEVEGRIIRHGRTVIVSSVEFRNKESRGLLYTARATFYSLPSANL